MNLTSLADGADDFTQAMETLSQNGALARRMFKSLDGYMVMLEQDLHVMQQQTEVSSNGFVHDWKINMRRPVYQAYWAQYQARCSPEFQALDRRYVECEDISAAFPLKGCPLP